MSRTVAGMAKLAVVLTPVAMLACAAPPTAAGEMARLLICVGQCVGEDGNGAPVPLGKGTALSWLETGPASYAQVKFGPGNACAIGENARVSFSLRDDGRDVVVLEQGRIRMIGGELMGQSPEHSVELRTPEGTLSLRSADIEVKAVPRAQDMRPGVTLMKLNLGDARIGDQRASGAVLYQIAGGRLVEPAVSGGPGEPPPQLR